MGVDRVEESRRWCLNMICCPNFSHEYSVQSSYSSRAGQTLMLCVLSSRMSRILKNCQVQDVMKIQAYTVRL